MYYKIRLLNNVIKVIMTALLISLSLSSVGCSKEKDVNRLIRKLKDKHSGARQGAAYALGETKDAHAANALLTALKDKRLDIIAGAYAFFLGRSNPETDDLLIEALNKYNVGGMAVAFLNCGNSKLEEVARLPGKKLGYNSTRLPDGRSRFVRESNKK